MFMKRKIKRIVREEIRKRLIWENIPSWDNPLTTFPFYGLNETLLHSLPAKKVCRWIKEYFKIEDDKIFITNIENVNIINVRTYLTKLDPELIEKAANYLGWFLSTPKLKYIEKMQEEYNEGKRDDQELLLQFEPKHQPDITDELKNSGEMLIHISPSYYLGKIKSIGFSPRTKNRLYDYPDRVYFLKSSISDDELIDIAERLNYHNVSKGNKGDYFKITIDPNKMPSIVRFYKDTNSKYGVYTTFNVPPETIINIEKLQLSDFSNMD